MFQNIKTNGQSLFSPPPARRLYWATSFTCRGAQKPPRSGSMIKGRWGCHRVLWYSGSSVKTDSLHKGVGLPTCPSSCPTVDGGDAHPQSSRHTIGGDSDLMPSALAVPGSRGPSTIIVCSIPYLFDCFYHRIFLWCQIFFNYHSNASWKM
jgi:hypothetical protein